MSSIINPANYSGYYQLSGQAGTNSGTSQTDPTQSLLQALSADTSTTPSNSSDAYLLNLSPQAQQYLNGVNSTSSTADTLDGGTGSFTLSSQQQQAITAILTKYKDAPYTQDTFNQIQNDLNAAGLGTNTLSMEDQATSFDPSLVLINALNGGSTDGAATGVTSSADESSKSSAYMQQIIGQWQNMSGNASGTSPDQTGVAPVGSSSGA